MELQTKVLAIIGIRAAALALAVTGQTRAANALYTLADATESGKAVDDHMAMAVSLAGAWFPSRHLAGGLRFQT